MKFRKDFVTNSSSSSFVCEICGESETYYDGLGEIGACSCENGHEFCQEHILDLPRNDMIQAILDVEKQYKDGDIEKHTKEELESLGDEELYDILTDDSCYDLPECLCPICQFIEYSQCDMVNFLLKEYKVPKSEAFDYVKGINKRRKKIYDHEYISYVANKFNLNIVEIQASWKDRFGTYSKFKDYIRER